VSRRSQPSGVCGPTLLLTLSRSAARLLTRFLIRRFWAWPPLSSRYRRALGTFMPSTARRAVNICWNCGSNGAIRISDFHERPLPTIRGGNCLLSRPDTPRHPAGASAWGKVFGKPKSSFQVYQWVERWCAGMVTRAQRRLYKRLTAPPQRRSEKETRNTAECARGNHTYLSHSLMIGSRSNATGASKRLSIIPALGSRLRPWASRTSPRSLSCSRSHVPNNRQLRK
jgi:hypothetical protein